MTSEDIANQLKAAIEECSRLREENKKLRSMLGIHDEKPKFYFFDIGVFNALRLERQSVTEEGFKILGYTYSC